MSSFGQGSPSRLPAPLAAEAQQGADPRVGTNRPRTPRVQTDIPMTSNFGQSPEGIVPDVILSPPIPNFPEGALGSPGPTTLHCAHNEGHMSPPPPPMPPRPSTVPAASGDRSLVSSPEATSAISRLTMAGDTPSPGQPYSRSLTDQDDEDMFEFEAHPANINQGSMSQPISRTTSEQGMSPPPLREYNPNTRAHTFGSLNAIPIENALSRGIRQSSPRPSGLYSSSDPSSQIPGSSIKVLKEPIERADCCCCGSSFVTRMHLDNHFRKVHKGSHTHPLCKTCGRTVFEDESDYQGHRMICGTEDAGIVGKRYSRGKRRTTAEHNPRHSTGSLSPVPIERPSSGRDSQQSLSGLSTSNPSDQDLFDFESPETESSKSRMKRKILQLASNTMASALQKTDTAPSDPSSPTKKRKSRQDAPAAFANAFTKYLVKALETGAIKLEELTENFDGGNNMPTIPSGFAAAERQPPDSMGMGTRQFPPRHSGGRTRPSSGQSPFNGTLACPYARGDPEMYLTCLLIHRKDLPGLREHIGRVHFGGRTPIPVIEARDWRAIFLVCFPGWNREVPDPFFDYLDTIEILQALRLGEPVNKFLRDLQKHLSYRHSREIEELEVIYAQKSWPMFNDFLNRAYSTGQPNPSPVADPIRPSQLEISRPPSRPPAGALITLCISRDIEFALEREVEFTFPLGSFRARDFRHWLDENFNPSPNFSSNHLVLHAYGLIIRSLDDLENFLNRDLPHRRPGHERHWDGVLTVFIRENWSSEMASTPGHHF
ncbi:hypothetical protein ABW19_dt0205380 [Dactylella cylindrospora]|nr:hypothetical protein ABW19_dt0205380 [Dactylella cylindrospora]